MEPPEKDEEEGFQPTGALDSSGTLESRNPLARRPGPAPRKAQLEPLELEERAPRPTTDYVPPPAPPTPRLPRRGGGGGVLLLFLLVLAGLGAGGWYLFFKPKTSRLYVPVAVVVLVTSDPLGASVSVEGTPVGVTPWATDNTWPRGPVNVTLTHPGYRPWTGTFPGGRPARLEAKLQRR